MLVRRWARRTGLVAAIVMAVVAASVPHPAASGRWTPLTYAPAPPDNPLKGFFPYRGAYATFPHSMEWEMVAWRDVQTAPDVFRWDALDAVLDDIASRGHQAVFRIYADAPNRPSALPSFLAGVRVHAYSDWDNGRDATSVAPDYDDPRVVTAMLALIRALGARYDGDPRIGFITVGLLGFWGEWHTFRPSCQCDTWMPSRATERAVLDAFDAAFAVTKLLVRNPDVGWDDHRIGFHDDSFAHLTLGRPDWTFLGRLATAGAKTVWKREPIGGELRPELQACAFSVPTCVPAGQTFATSTATAHVSWLLNHDAFVGMPAADRPRAEAAARWLGYELHVSAVRLRDTLVTRPLKVEARIQNRGVAPFYYAWPVWLGLADAGGRLVGEWRTSWDLTRPVERGRDVTYSATFARHVTAPGTYRVLLRVEHPLSTARALRFANAEADADVVGWISLGSVTVGVK